MGILIIYDAITGEIEGNCNLCGIVSGLSASDLAGIDGHGIKEVPPGINPYLISSDGMHYRYKVDVSTGELIDRDGS